MLDIARPRGEKKCPEGLGLQVPDIDGDRAMLHIHGKRAEDRYVPLPDATLSLLRTHWRIHRDLLWLLPARHATKVHGLPGPDYDCYAGPQHPQLRLN